MPMNKTEKKKQWHMGFYGAMELEFREDKEILEYLREYQLSKKPLSMDMLIVKKNSDKSLIPIQIIVTKELEPEEHISLRILSDNVTEKDAKNFVEKASLMNEKDDRENADAILQISVSANKTIYDRVKEEDTMCDALRDLMKEEIEEEKNKAIKEERMATIRALMKNLKCSAEKAMESMGIPKSEYPNYMNML